MEFFSCLSAPALAHCPIQGPQALVKIVASKSSKISSKPSLSAAARFDDHHGARLRPDPAPARRGGRLRRHDRPERHPGDLRFVPGGGDDHRLDPTVTLGL